MKTSKLYSKVAQYEVHGEPIFEREDAAGIIVKDAAISLAKAQCQDNDTVLDAQALPVEDERGFYCYWVNLKVENAPGADRLISYLIDPYQGLLEPGRPAPPRPVQRSVGSRPAEGESESTCPCPRLFFLCMRGSKGSYDLPITGTVINVLRFTTP